MKILVIDDSAAMRMIVVRTLRKAGFKDHVIVEAGNGVEGLAKVRSESPDLVMSDWNMPEMTGIALLQALRAEGNTLPFGFVTSEFTEEMRAQASQAGAIFLIAKPFNEDTFREALEAHIA